MLENTREIIWVTDSPQLNSLCEQWSEQAFIVLDTEFIRTDTYYPIPALIQVSEGKANYLLEPELVKSSESFKALLLKPEVKKVFHACSEDLEVFDHLFGFVPTPLFDTQIAASFCGFGFSVGYANLVKAALGIELPKDETRSDWLQRPLSPTQEVYAALDVQFLHELCGLLLQRLSDSGRLPWVEEDCQALIQNYKEAQAPENAVNRFKGAWRLKPASQQVLFALALWREEQAQKKDLPRNHVIKEKALYEIAESLPRHMGQLRKIPMLHDRAVRKYGETVLDIVSSSLANDSGQHVVQRPLSNKQNKTFKILREKITGLSEQLDIAPEILARKKDLEYAVRMLEKGVLDEQAFPPHFAGWRRQQVLEPLLELDWHD